jgi:hypothetical protein
MQRREMEAPVRFVNRQSIQQTLYPRIQNLARERDEPGAAVFARVSLIPIFRRRLHNQSEIARRWRTLRRRRVTGTARQRKQAGFGMRIHLDQGNSKAAGSIPGGTIRARMDQENLRRQFQEKRLILATLDLRRKRSESGAIENGEGGCERIGTVREDAGDDISPPDAQAPKRLCCMSYMSSQARITRRRTIRGAKREFVPSRKVRAQTQNFAKCSPQSGRRQDAPLDSEPGPAKKVSLG